tara:strand:+ start:324 stop:986 length:663 start_codon:yes stop_codon:yes gene_type:complete
MSIINLLKNGSAITFKNFLPLLGSLLLYILTIWIPYINIGTTIAIWTLPAVMSRGETMSPTQIFDSKYRKNMGNFFLLLGFMFSGILIGFIYGIIPGIVLAYSWSLAILLLVDKNLNPIQALHESNLRTYGHKVTIFFTYLLFSILLYIIVFGGYMLLHNIFVPSQAQFQDWMLYGSYYDIRFYSVFVVMFLVLVACSTIQFGIMAEIYKQLVSDNPEKA